MTDQPPDSPLKDPRARGAFLAHLRHELRTPVNAILGYSEMLIEDAEGAAREVLLEDLRKIRAAGQGLLELINEILDAGKAETADLESFGARMRHDLRTPVNAILGYSEMLLEDAEAAGEEGLAADLRKIRGAGQRLLALIDDILRVSKMEAGQLEVDVGSSAVSSMIHGVVSTIRPLAERGGGSEGEGGYLLVVDDNEMNRDMLSRLLVREGYTVAVAENGKRALEMIQAQAFDLVLLDLMMPVMNGFEALGRLKADPVLRHLPVIMISALDEIDSVVRCIEVGAEDYLPKPFNPTLLKARIGASLEKKRLRDREVLHLRQIEQERRRADELLHVILPHEIAEELKATSRVRPKRYDDAAVMFCDIVGFTPYCAGRSPEEVVARLQDLVEVYEELALRHDLQKIKTIGDSFMAAAGAIKPVENPVLSCVRCGLEMLQASRRLPAKWEVRVGIHVGPVMAGVVGHRQYLFDLWGDTVNTASRVESHGKNGAVNVSAAAWQRISGLCRGASLGLVKLKGIGEMEIFRVDGLA